MAIKFETIPLSEVQLGDDILLSPMPHVHTVRQIKDGKIHLFRPYTHCANFSYTGGVVCYVGVEEYWLDHNMNIEVQLVERRNLA